MQDYKPLFFGCHSLNVYKGMECLKNHLETETYCVNSCFQHYFFEKETEINIYAPMNAQKSGGIMVSF